MRAYVSCVIACPFEGAIAPEAVREMAERMLALGCYEVSLGDTIGAGTPDSVAAMLDCVLGAIPAAQLAGHFHDTGGRALANVQAAMDRGLTIFDSAVGGLGGCPYAPGARGNVATGELARMLEGAGHTTGIDLAALARAEAHLASISGKDIATA